MFKAHGPCSQLIVFVKFIIDGRPIEELTFLVLRTILWSIKHPELPSTREHIKEEAPVVSLYDKGTKISFRSRKRVIVTNTRNWSFYHNEESEVEVLVSISKSDKDDYSKDGTPFHLSISESVLPLYKASMPELYNSSSDPWQHVQSFRAMVQLQWAIDALLCMTLERILKSHLIIGNNLPPCSICSFRQLSHFLSNNL